MSSKQNWQTACWRLDKQPQLPALQPVPTDVMSRKCGVQSGGRRLLVSHSKSASFAKDLHVLLACCLPVCFRLCVFGCLPPCTERREWCHLVLVPWGAASSQNRHRVSFPLTSSSDAEKKRLAIVRNTVFVDQGNSKKSLQMTNGMGFPPALVTFRAL